MKPELLKIFVTVCDCLSFSKASEVLHCPKSTVSDGIKKLEELVGVRLLKRTTRSVQVTDEGLLFYEKSIEVLDQLNELESVFTSSELSTTRGRVRVDMPVAMAKNFIIPSLHSFIELYPEIDIELSSSDRQVDLISEGFDFVIRVGKMKDSSLIARKIGEYKVVNCVSPKYIQKFGRPSLKKLDNHYLIHYLQNLGVGQDRFEYFDGSKINYKQMRASLIVNNTISYTQACLEGIGLAQIPKQGIRDFGPPHQKWTFFLV